MANLAISNSQNGQNQLLKLMRALGSSWEQLGALGSFWELFQTFDLNIWPIQAIKNVQFGYFAIFSTFKVAILDISAILNPYFGYFGYFARKVMPQTLRFALVPALNQKPHLFRSLQVQSSPSLLTVLSSNSVGEGGYPQISILVCILSQDSTFKLLRLSYSVDIS